MLERLHRLAGSGEFWMYYWACVFAVMICWGVATFLWWMESVRNLNALSIAAVWLACGAGLQATLAMRKTDPNDPL